MTIDLSLLRLLQLASPGLPIGMYSYSQGLERAVDDGWVNDLQQTEEWIAGILEQCLLRVDLPIAARLYDAWSEQDEKAVENWSITLLAWRETAELRAEDRQTGQALARLLANMDLSEAGSWQRKDDTTLAAMFALAAVKWQIPKKEMLAGYVWGWLENQVLNAVKLVPLGQVAGQRLLYKISVYIPELLQQGLQLEDDEIGGSVFGAALASSRHEMQYSRLFRS